MKKFLSATLALTLGATMAFSLAACDSCGSEDDNSAANKATAEAAIEIVVNNHINDPIENNSEYTVIGKVRTADGLHDVKWSVSSDDYTDEQLKNIVSVSESMNSSNRYTVSVTPQDVVVEYTLTASVTVGGETASHNFEKKVSEKVAEGDVTFDFSGVKYYIPTGASYATAYTDAEAFEALKAAGGTNHGLTAVTATNIFPGSDGNNGGMSETDGYIKTGSSSANGKLVLTFEKAVSKVVIEAQGWKDNSAADNDSISVNNSTPQNPTDGNSVALTYTIDASKTVTIETAKRVFIFKIYVYYAAAGTHVHDPGEYTHVAGTMTHRAECQEDGCDVEYLTGDCEAVLNKCSVCGYEYSVDEILEAAEKLEHNGTLKGTYSLTGVVDELLADGTSGDPQFYFQVKGATKEARIQARYVKLAAGVSKPAVGDTVTIQGTPSKFNSTIQFNSGAGTVVSLIPGEGTGSENPPATTGTFTPITAPAAGEYYYAIVKPDGVYYLTGEMSGYYFATSTNVAEAAKVNLVADGDGWLIKQGNRFIEIEISGTYNNVKFNETQTAGKHWVWNAEFGVLTWTNDNGTLYLGTYDNYKTFSASDISRLEGNPSSQYPAQFGTLSSTGNPGTEPETPVEPGDGKGTTIDNPFTTAEALAIINALGKDEYYKVNGAIATVYVEGYIVSNNTSYSEQYGNWTSVYIGGSPNSKPNDADVLQIYRLYPDGTLLKGSETLTKGSKIVVVGVLQNYYGNTPEITNNGDIKPKAVVYEAATEQPAEEGVVSFDSTMQGYTNAQDVTTVKVEDVTITFAKGSNSNPPKYYTSGTAIRVYGGNTMTFSVPNGYKITKITITFGGSDGTNEITADKGTFATDTWTGSEQTVVLTVGGTTGNRRVQVIDIEYEEVASAAAVSAVEALPVAVKEEY